MILTCFAEYICENIHIYDFLSQLKSWTVLIATLILRRGWQNSYILYKKITWLLLTWRYCLPEIFRLQEHKGLQNLFSTYCIASYIISRYTLNFHYLIPVRRCTSNSLALTGMGLFQIRKIAWCACVGNAGNVFPATAGKRSRHALRHVRDAWRDRQLAVSFKVGGGKKRSRHSWRMRNPQICVSGKRPNVHLWPVSLPLR